MELTSGWFKFKIFLQMPETIIVLNNCITQELANNIKEKRSRTDTERMDEQTDGRKNTRRTKACFALENANDHENCSGFKIFER